jgi:hypothetical protein
MALAAGMVASAIGDYQNKQQDPSPFQKATVQSCSGMVWQPQAGAFD